MNANNNNNNKKEEKEKEEKDDAGVDGDPGGCVVDLQECLEMVDDFINLYQGSREEDVARIEAIANEHKEAQTTSRKRERHMSEVIREMTKRVQNAERKTSALLSSTTRSDRFRKAEEEKRAAERYWSRMEREAQTLEDTRKILKKKRNEMKKKRREMDVLVTEEIPKLKNALSLYAHATKIAWKYEQKSKIEGRVNNSARGEVKRIDAAFPRTEEERFRLCNSIWDLID